MKYYGEIGTINTPKIANFPNKYPAFLLISEEEKRKYNALMVAAAQRGFNMSKRKVCFTLLCEEGYYHEEIYNSIKNLPEISEGKYNLLKQIPHWNPILVAMSILEGYLTLLKNAGVELDEDKELQALFKEVFDERIANQNPRLNNLE